jgi:VIT1/CCC1 family predicted Fe2+/Mn2+ transporter
LAFGESFSSQQIFAISAALTGVTFFITGLFRGRVVGQSMLVGGVETLLVGGAAAGLAFFVGSLLKGLIS